MPALLEADRGKQRPPIHRAHSAPGEERGGLLPCDLDGGGGDALAGWSLGPVERPELPADESEVGGKTVTEPKRGSTETESEPQFHARGPSSPRAMEGRASGTLGRDVPGRALTARRCGVP